MQHTFQRSVIKPVFIIILLCVLLGESCGNGTLGTLETTIKERLPNVYYECYNVYGDPKDSAQVQGLTDCAANIISSRQQGELVHTYAHHFLFISNTTACL